MEWGDPETSTEDHAVQMRADGVANGQQYLLLSFAQLTMIALRNVRRQEIEPHTSGVVWEVVPRGEPRKHRVN